jgi:midasin (ATPase involved in ribosome maturation)
MMHYWREFKERRECQSTIEERIENRKESLVKFVKEIGRGIERKNSNLKGGN